MLRSSKKLRLGIEVQHSIHSAAPESTVRLGLAQVINPLPRDAALFLATLPYVRFRHLRQPALDSKPRDR